MLYSKQKLHPCSALLFSLNIFYSRLTWAGDEAKGWNNLYKKNRLNKKKTSLLLLHLGHKFLYHSLSCFNPLWAKTTMLLNVLHTEFWGVFWGFGVGVFLVVVVIELITWWCAQSHYGHASWFFISQPLIKSL